MNYLKELKAFRDWLLLNDLNTSAIALWHTLMTINNMTGWKERFNAPNSTVEKLTGLSKQGLVDARKRLIDNGLIEYEKGKKGKAPIYKMLSLVNSFDLYSYQSDDQCDDQTPYQSDDQNLTIPKHKLNKTKQNINKKEDEDGQPQNPFRFFEENGFGLISPYISENISQWIDDLSPDLVIEAMKITIEQGVRTWKYVESILRDWSKKGLKTVEQVKADQLAYRESKSRKGNAYSRKPVRQEIVPEFMKNKEVPATEQPEHDVVSFEEKRRLFEERLNKQKNG